MTYEEFMKIVREKNEWKKHPENWTEAERLRERIMHGEKTIKQCLDLEKELIEFIAKNPSEEELAKLQGCGESISMICNAIREKR